MGKVVGVDGITAQRWASFDWLARKEYLKGKVSSRSRRGKGH